MIFLIRAISMHIVSEGDNRPVPIVQRNTARGNWIGGVLERFKRVSRLVPFPTLIRRRNDRGESPVRGDAMSQVSCLQSNLGRSAISIIVSRLSLHIRVYFYNLLCAHVRAGPPR